MALLGTLALVVVAFVALMFGLALVPMGLDWLNARAIKAVCEQAGCTVLTIKPWSNHYGVTLQKNAATHYLKCVGIFGKIRWQGRRPEEL